MSNFDELLAQLLDEPPQVLGVLADVVARGRMQAADLPEEGLEILARYDLISFLVTRAPKRPVMTWVYPSPSGLKVFSVLEREAERQEQQAKRLKVTVKGKKRRPKNDSGVSR